MDLPASAGTHAPRQGWAEAPPPDPEIRLEPTRFALMSPSSGEHSSSPIETLERAETGSLDDSISRTSASGGQVYSLSGHVSQQARQRIREKTKTMVEKQRRQAKRMARSHRSESSEGEPNGMGEGPQQKEFVQSDQQIEQSIQLAAKYVEGKIHWDDRPTADGEKENDTGREATSALLVLAPAQPMSREASAKFAQMIVWRGADQRPWKGDLEKGQSRGMDSSDNNAIGQRQLLITHSVAKPFSSDDEFGVPAHLTVARQLLQWRAPLGWNDWLRQSGTRRLAAQPPTGLWLDLQGIQFDHHWLFTRAEAAERELLAAFDAWAEVHQQVLGAVKSWLTLRQREAEEVPKNGETDEEDGQNTEAELNALFAQILTRQSELNRCRAAMERAWAGSDQSRGRFLLERLEGHAEVFEEESEGGVPEQLRSFFHSPLFVLSQREDHETREAQRPVPELEKQRRAATADCYYQVQMFFNELLVCTTEERPLEWPSFSISFGQIFPLRVFEKPEQLRLALRERFGRGDWQQLVDIFVPLPEEDEEEQKSVWMAQTGLQFASTVLRGSYKGSLGCAQGGLPFVQGRLFCTLRWQHHHGLDGSTGQKRRAHNHNQRQSPSPPSLFPAGTFLCPEETLQKDPRLLALERRWQERMESRGQPQKRVGIQQSEELMSGLDLDERRPMSPGGGEMELERQRRLGQEFALALRRHIRESGEQQRRARDPAELIREEPMPQFGFGLLSALLSNRQMDVSRRLKPVRQTSVTRPFVEPSIRPRLMLNIQHASGIPLRNNGEATQLFLVCTVLHQSQATALVDGRHANWQETLVLDIPSISPAAGHAEQFLEVEMFDREVRLMEHDDREQDTRHERVERRWLGSARVPLSALYAVTKLDGHLALQEPLFFSGYKKLVTEQPITVRVLISLDPPTMPSAAASSMASSQFGESDGQLISECLKFEGRLHQRFPSRRVLALATDSSGKRMLATRFLRRLVPPPQVVALFDAGHQQKAIHLAAQIVASIPTFHDQQFQNQLPIWSTADEILRVGTASPDEQGLLLCCWLLGLQLSAVLLLGPAMPNGPHCAFVLVQLVDGQHWLISPGQGHHFTPSDPNCPLLSVGTCLTMENVFVNVQRAEHSSQLDFDLRKREHWEPLFAENRKNLVSIQPEMLRFEPVEENSLMELRTGLERQIRLEFDEARPFAVPQWNLLASRTLRELMAESWAEFSSAIGQPVDIDAKLSQLRPAFYFSALAFRVPFISRAQVVRQVLRTMVHTNSEPQAQFALAVHLQPFFGTTLACSVAICTLMPSGSNTIRNK